MSPNLRLFIAGLISATLAAWVGLSLAKEEHLVAMALAGVSVWAILSWTRGPLAESWLLGFLIFGYVIGNRGFAQLAPISGLPLFLSELGLAAVGTLVVLRGALRRELPLRRDWLNGLLLLWLALGAGRIFWDVRIFGFVALRDFAMVYYVLYFFAAQILARHAPSRRVMRGALTLTFGLLPLTALLAVLFPDFFQSNLLVDRVPLIFYKNDLLATFLFTGYIVLLPVGPARWPADWWRWLTALGSLLLGLSLLSRSSMLGLVVALGWLVLARRWRPLLIVIGLCATGLVAVTTYSLLEQKDFTQTKAYAIYEAVVSIADFSGTRDYQNELSSDKGDNNRFRLVWWKNVTEETLTNSPIVGLGFGADLAHGFLLEYYPTGDLDFTARSPHNIFMTTFGRMGLLGLAVLLGVYARIGFSTARVAREVRNDPARQPAMTLQAAVWVVMISACLGVVLEGPMGAIPFWIILGLAHHGATSAEETSAIEVAAN